MKNNTTILDSFTETETIKEERERTVIDVVDVEVKTNYLVLQITKKDAQLLAALGDSTASRTVAMHEAGTRLAQKLEMAGSLPRRW